MKNTLLLILLLGLVCRVAFAQEDEDQPQEQQEDQAADEQNGDGQEPAEDGEDDSVDAMARQKRSAEAGGVYQYDRNKVIWEDKAKHDREAAYLKNRRTKYRDQKLLKKEADRFAAKDLYVRKPGLKLDEKAYVKDHKWRQFEYDAKRHPYQSYSYKKRPYGYGRQRYDKKYRDYHPKYPVY